MAKIKKVGVLGGSFNPIHNSHLKIAEILIREKVVDEVWLMPCKNHIFNKQLLDWKTRVKMIKLAIEKSKKIKVHLAEISMRGKSCTIKTLRALRKNHPYDFYMIIGSDILHEITRWHKYQELKKEAKFIVIKRCGYSVKNPGIKIAKILSYKPDNRSSTQVRDNLRQRKSISHLVPNQVSRYIKKHRLYQ